MNYLGLNASNGRAIVDDAQLQQCVQKVLTTPLYQRVQRRLFGSQLPELVDAPLNGKTRMQCLAATAMALARHEPRIELHRVGMRIGAGSQAGTLAIDIEARRRDGPAAGQALNLSVGLR